jgi:hypothetical protein
LRDGLIAVDPQHRRVIAGRVTDKKIPQPFRGREFRQDRVKVILTQLAGSTAGRGERGEGRIGLDLPLHRAILLESKNAERRMQNAELRKAHTF